MSVEICDAAGTPINTGAVKQCIEGKIKHIALTKTAFSFATVAAAVTEATWATAIEEKDIVPLYDLYEVANANVEATKYEVDEFTFETAKAVKKLTFESYLGLCSHKALKSYQGSDYTKVLHITEDGAIIGVLDGLTVKGQELSDFNVSIREETTKDKPATSLVTLSYKDYEELEDSPFGDIPTWDANALDGVFNVTLVTSGIPIATEIIVLATTGCGNVAVTGLLVADFAYTGGTLASVTESPDGTYTFTGTGLTSGTLGTDDVVTVGETFYEGIDVAVTI